jgi:hypothetical protein
MVEIALHVNALYNPQSNGFEQFMQATQGNDSYGNQTLPG